MLSKEFKINEQDLMEIQNLIKNNASQDKVIFNPNELNYAKVLKPWGYEYLFYQDKEMAIWLLHIKAGAATSLHCHLEKETTMYVIQGSVIVSGLNKEVKLTENESLQIDKKVFHKTYSKKGAYLFEIEKPNKKLDLLRLKDDYGRNDSNYENSDSFMKLRKNYDYIDSRKVKNENNFIKYVGEKKITIDTLNSILDKNYNLKESGFILLDVDDQEDKLLKGKLVSPNQLSVSIDDKLMIISRYGNIQTGAQYISDRLGINKNVIFTSIGDLNMHLIETVARNENIEINILPSDQIALKSLSAYNKVSEINGIFIPSTSFDSLLTIPQLITNWIDSNYFFGIYIDSDFNKEKIGKKLKQGSNKGFPLEDLLGVIASKICKIGNLQNLNKFRAELFFVKLNNRLSKPHFLLIPISFCTEIFNVKWNLIEKTAFKFFFNLLNLKDRILCHLAKIRTRYFYKTFIFKLLKAKRPVVVLGNGVLDHPVLLKKFLEIMESYRIPIFTTRSAIGILSNDSPNYYGRIGGYGSRIGNHIYNSADFILSIGARYSSSLTTRNPENFNQSATRFIIDLNKKELKKVFFGGANKYAIDSKYVLEKLNSNLNIDVNPEKYQHWTTKLRVLYNGYNPHSRYAQADVNDVYKFIHEACLTFSENDLIVVDGGEILHFVTQAAVVKRNQKWLNLSSLEETNFAIEAAVGLYIFMEKHENLKRSRIKVFCDDLTFWNSQEVVHYIDFHKLPIDIIIISKKQSRFRNDSHKKFYSHSLIRSEDTNLGVNLNYVANKLGNFNLRNLYEPRVEGLNDIVIFHVSPEQEMNPRPAFNINESGIWTTKTLNEMDPKVEIDDNIQSDIEGLINECK